MLCALETHLRRPGWRKKKVIDLRDLLLLWCHYLMYVSSARLFSLPIWSCFSHQYHLVLPAYTVLFFQQFQRLLRIIASCFHIYMGTAVAQWLRCCATNRKVAGSILDGVIGVFHWHKPSDRTMALVVDSASNINEYQEHFLGVKAAGA